MGCHFDQLTWSWLPPNCPHYANDNYLDVEPWKYYEKLHGNATVDGEQWETVSSNSKSERKNIVDDIFRF